MKQGLILFCLVIVIVIGLFGMRHVVLFSDHVEVLNGVEFFQLYRSVRQIAVCEHAGEVSFEHVLEDGRAVDCFPLSFSKLYLEHLSREVWEETLRVRASTNWYNGFIPTHASLNRIEICRLSKFIKYPVDVLDQVLREASSSRMMTLSVVDRSSLELDLRTSEPLIPGQIARGDMGRNGLFRMYWRLNTRYVPKSDPSLSLLRITPCRCAGTSEELRREQSLLLYTKAPGGR